MPLAQAEFPLAEFKPQSENSSTEATKESPNKLLTMETSLVNYMLNAKRLTEEPKVMLSSTL